MAKSFAREIQERHGKSLSAWLREIQARDWTTGDYTQLGWRGRFERITPAQVLLKYGDPKDW